MRSSCNQSFAHPCSLDHSSVHVEPQESFAIWCRQATLYYIDWCRQSFGIRGLVDFWLGTNAVPMVHLTHPNGSTASIHLQGANVTSWTNPDGAELLHLREQNPDEPIQ